MCRAIPFSAHALKKHFLSIDVKVLSGKKQIEMWFIVDVLLSTMTMRHYSFPKHFFILFLLSEFATKVFERKVSDAHE